MLYWLWTAARLCSRMYPVLLGRHNSESFDSRVGRSGRALKHVEQFSRWDDGCRTAIPHDRAHEDDRLDGCTEHPSTGLEAVA